MYNIYIIGSLSLREEGGTADTPLFGIFGERFPTGSSTLYQWLHATVDGDDFAKAHDRAVAQMDQDPRFVRVNNAHRDCWTLATAGQFRRNVSKTMRTA